MAGEYDIHRSEGEGMVFHSEYHPELREDDPELDAFLTSIVETFEEDPEILELRAAILVRVANMKNRERVSMVGVAKKHFVEKVCLLHDCDIVNTDEEPLNYELTAQSIRGFLVKEGENSLMAHLECFLPKEKWENIKKTEKERFESFTNEYINDERFLAGTPG